MIAAVVRRLLHRNHRHDLTYEGHGIWACRTCRQAIQ